MKWIAISGGWRTMNQRIEEDVRKTVREIISRGNGIVSGGALGVDYIATDEALKLNPSASQVKIFLPTLLAIYSCHYRKRAEEGVITHEQAEVLIEQLERLRSINPQSLVEDQTNSIVDTKTYYRRNLRVIDAVDELIAFYVNKSKGTQDTITKAEQKGIPVKKFEYTIE